MIWEDAMAQELQVTFQGIQRSEALQKAIAGELQGLHKFNPDLGRCRVLVTQEGHQVQGIFTVRSTISASGKEITVSKTDKDALRAVRMVFDTLRRSVGDSADKAIPH